MSLQAFADLLNSIGPVAISRFGLTSHIGVQVQPQGTLQLHEQHEQAGSIVGESTCEVELVNIQSVEFKELTFEGFERPNPSQYMIYLYFNNKIISESRIPGKAIDKRLITNTIINVPSRHQAEQIKAFIEEAI